MTTRVEKSVLVDVPVSTVYNQWTQFEEFPQFMGGVQEVRQLDDRRLHWVAEIAGVKRQWDATIVEQVPDEKVAWAATEGATNAGAVYFSPVGAGQTSVRLVLEYEPEGLVEGLGDKLNIIEKRAEADLEKFKSFIESRGLESGGWRGGVNEGAAVGAPGVEAAQSSEGDSGKAGLSAKTVAAGAAVAAAGVAAAAAANRSSSDESETTTEVPDVQPATDVAGTGTYAAEADVVEPAAPADDVVVVEETTVDTGDGLPADRDRTV